MNIEYGNIEQRLQIPDKEKLTLNFVIWVSNYLPLK